MKMEFPEGYLSIKEKLGTIMANEEGAKVLMELFEKLGAGSGMGKSMKNMMGMITVSYTHLDVYKRQI